MKIKLAILDKDQGYLNKIVTTFTTRYADKLEIYSFSDSSIALDALESARIDVLVASEDFDIEVNALPKRCGFAYFVDTNNIDTFNEQKAICKFQKADLIFKQILSIYSENCGSIAGLKMGDDSCKVISFLSPSGGAGASSLAAACAVRFSQQGKKTLYLNLEKYGSADVFFAAEGQFSIGDIIFSLKSKKANLALKLESCVKQDHTGVYFYSQSKIALDMLELEKEEIIRLITELKLTNAFDYIVVDMDFSLSADVLDIYYTMDTIVLVGDGSEISNIKVLRVYDAMMVREKEMGNSLLDRMVLVYNKFSNKTGKIIEGIEISNIGGAPKYEHASTVQVITQLAEMSMFDTIM